MSCIKHQMIDALRTKYEGDYRVAHATLNIYMDKPVAIGEHPQHAEEMDKLVDAMASAQDKLDLFSVLASRMNDMHTIEEDEAKCINSVQNEKKEEAKEIRRRGKRDKESTRQRNKHPDDTHKCVGETYDMPLQDTATAIATDSKEKDDTRRRQVGSRCHDDKPLRSSLKKESSESLYNLDSSMNSTGSNKMRRISFGSLEIRSYPVTLGDAPTTNGPPVQLDWVRIFRLFDILSIIEHSHLTTLLSPPH